MQEGSEGGQPPPSPPPFGRRAPPRVPRSRVAPAAAPRRAPLASSSPGPTEAHPPGAPRRPSPRRQPLSNRRGALRGAARAPTPPRVHHARAPHPAPSRVSIGSEGGARGGGGGARGTYLAAGRAASGGRPRARERRSRGASEPGCRRRRFRVGGSHVTATGLRTAPAERGSGGGAGGSAGREITIKGRDAARRKRKRCAPSRSRAAGPRTKGGRPPTRLPPRPVLAASWAPRQQCAAPRDRPAPAPTPKPAGCRAGGGPAPICGCAPGPGRCSQGLG